MPGELILWIPPVLLGAGMFLLFSGKAADREFERRMLFGAKEKLEGLRFEQTLKDRILTLRGQAKPSLIREAFRTKGSVLPPLLGISAFLLSRAMLGSLFPAVPVGLACFLLPTWSRKLRSYRRAESDSLETEAALSIITSSYLKSSDLVGAVEENAAYIKPPVRDLFLRFLFEYRNVTPNVQTCLANLKQRFTNGTARQWCDLAIEAQSTATVRYAMQSALSRFRTEREIQSEYNASLRQSMRDFRTVVLIIAAFIPGLRFYSGEWFSILTGTPQGKASLSLLLTLMLLGINRSVELQEPVTFDRRAEK